ncbi:MAG: glycosyltransferase [Brachybacterium sp.]|nr:glycosyltransferase [Brachybacterium sp.]
MTTMVFHAPYPVTTGGTGSAARPPRMLQAFRDLGHEVLDVTGHGAERERRVRALAARLNAGQRIDFAYGESSTMPSVLTEPHHLPTHPLVDLRLLRLLRRYQVPTGLFYRDVYWRFPAYDEMVHPLIGMGTKALYRTELVVMGRWLDRIYLPSELMAPYVPYVPISKTRALPPGGIIRDEASETGESASWDQGADLTLLYVGNISEYYRMHAVMDAVNRTEGVRLILCTPEDSWTAVRAEYAQLLGPSIEVVHRRGEGLAELFARADVCALIVEPAEYRDFAAPLKLFEYLGHGKPVLASAGTHAATLVSREGLGWEVAYDVDAIVTRLHALREDADEVHRVREVVRERREAHTWTARARQVAEDLTSLR